MEFPELGQSCAVCQQLDFLPFVCVHCRTVFCKQHLSVDSHPCKDFEENRIDHLPEKEKVEKTRCRFCSQRISQELQIVSCPKCDLKYCLAHRHAEAHDCPKLKEERLQANVRAMKEDDQTTKNKVVKAPAVRGSKNEALARKVALMQLKQKGVGPAVPFEERLHLFVVHPVSEKKEPFYFSKTWTIGRCCDFVVDRLKLQHNFRLCVIRAEDELPVDSSLFVHQALAQSLFEEGDTFVLRKM